MRVDGHNDGVRHGDGYAWGYRGRCAGHAHSMIDFAQQFGPLLIVYLLLFEKWLTKDRRQIHRQDAHQLEEHCHHWFHYQ